jgi:cyclin B
MNAQNDINNKMRSILVDWLVEVHQKYHLRPVTLFLTINIVDRYLAAVRVPRKRLQLVGVVAMFIAAKFEEIQPPTLKDYVYIADNAYTKSDVMNLECVMLSTLKFRVCVPTVAQFLECFQRANKCDKVHGKVSSYLAELALMDQRLASQPPSLLAAASVLLSNDLVGRNPRWPSALVRHARHTEIELQSCVTDIRAILAGAKLNSLQAVQRKYSLQTNHAVAKLVSVPA